MWPKESFFHQAVTDSTTSYASLIVNIVMDNFQFHRSASTDHEVTTGEPREQARTISDTMTLPLLSLPTDIAVRIIKMLPLPTCARFCYVYSDAQELVVQALRGRAVDAGRAVPSQLPGHEMSWLQALLWREWWQITHRAPSLALAMCHSLVIGKEGELLTW